MLAADAPRRRRARLHRPRPRPRRSTAPPSRRRPASPRSEIASAVGLDVDNAGRRGRADLGPAERGRSCGGRLRRRARRDLPGQLAGAPEQRVLMRSGFLGEVAARPASLHAPRSAGWRMSCSSPRDASFSSPAMPIWAMAAARSISTSRLYRRRGRGRRGRERPRRFTAARARWLRRRLVHARAAHLDSPALTAGAGRGEGAHAARRGTASHRVVAAPVGADRRGRYFRASPPAATSSSPPAAAKFANTVEFPRLSAHARQRLHAEHRQPPRQERRQEAISASPISPPARGICGCRLRLPDISPRADRYRRARHPGHARPRPAIRCWRRGTSGACR